jgi:hypothetical protein
MTDFERDFDEYLKLSWSSWAKGVQQAQKQLMAWLFTVHGAGIAGSLGYAASHRISCALTVALISFVVGIICLLIWGTLMYYFGVSAFSSFETDVAAVESQKMTVQDFIHAQNERSKPYRLCEALAWVSGLAGLVGLFGLIYSVVLG